MNKCLAIVMLYFLATSTLMAAETTAGPSYGKAIYCAGQGRVFTFVLGHKNLNKKGLDLDPRLLNIMLSVYSDISTNASRDALVKGGDKGISATHVDAAIVEASLSATNAALTNPDATPDAQMIILTANVGTALKSCSEYISAKTIDNVNQYFKSN